MITEAKLPEKIKFAFEKYINMPVAQVSINSRASTADQFKGAELLQQKASPIIYLPVYQLGLDDIEGELPLSSLLPTSYIAHSNSSNELTIEVDARNAELRAFIEPPFLNLIKAEIDKVPQGNDENSVLVVALLQVKALYVTALWIRCEDNANLNSIVPVGRVYQPLEFERHYTEKTFLSAVAGMAIAYREAIPNTL